VYKLSKLCVILFVLFGNIICVMVLLKKNLKRVKRLVYLKLKLYDVNFFFFAKAFFFFKLQKLINIIIKKIIYINIYIQHCNQR
jgi:hypothetical protein